MIWGTAGRQHSWLAVGARTFALLSLVLPLILKHNQLMLMALLALGAIWAAVTAGELLDLPHTRRPPSWARWLFPRSPPVSVGASAV
jgi:hypothetical protein